jgi:hypothetical protein
MSSLIGEGGGEYLQYEPVIPACAGMTNLERKNLPTPEIK